MFVTLKKRIFIYLIGLILTASGYTSHKNEDDADKENMCNLNKFFTQLNIENEDCKSDQLIDRLKSLQYDINQSHEQANVEQLFKCYQQFAKNLMPIESEEVWQQIAGYLKVKRWSSQKSWIEAVGSHLFFPRLRLYRWLETPYTIHLIDRIDMLVAYAIAAKLNHPLGYYYLGERFFDINYTTDSKEDKKLFSTFLDRAFPSLNQLSDHPDVTYALGRYNDMIRIVTSGYDTGRADEYYQKGQDFKNQFAFLNIKEHMRLYHQPATADEYLTLAAKDYPPAYFAALKKTAAINPTLVNDLLEKALNTNYPSIFILKGIAEKRMKGHVDYAKPWFEKAAMGGIPFAYVMLGIDQVGDLRNHNYDLKTFLTKTPAQIKEAAYYFKLAGQAHDPIGYELLGHLHHKLSQCTNIIDQLNTHLDKVVEAWNAGAALGSKECYFNLLNDRMLDVYENYPIFNKSSQHFPGSHLASTLIDFINSDNDQIKF